MVLFARAVVSAASLLAGVGYCLANPPPTRTYNASIPWTPPPVADTQSNDTRPDPGRGFLNLPWRVNARCIFTVVKDQGFVQRMYNVFMTTDSVKNRDWCEILERYLRTHCDEPKKDEEGEWLKDIVIDFARCDNDAKDMNWEKGSIATFKFSRSEMYNEDCVTSAVMAAAAGAKVDWMVGEGCYLKSDDDRGHIPW